MPEIGVLEIRDKPDGFAGRFHFGAQLFIYFGEFIEGEHRFFNSIANQFAFDGEIFQLVYAQHDLRRNIDVRYIISLGDERNGARCAGVGLYHVNLFIFYGELNIQQVTMTP